MLFFPGAGRGWAVSFPAKTNQSPVVGLRRSPVLLEPV